MKKFEKPSVLVVKFDLEDVVATSGTTSPIPEDNFDLPEVGA